jgi:hypothetical protein
LYKETVLEELKYSLGIFLDGLQKSATLTLGLPNKIRGADHSTATLIFSQERTFLELRTVLLYSPQFWFVHNRVKMQSRFQIKLMPCVSEIGVGVRFKI